MKGTLRISAVIATIVFLIVGISAASESVRVTSDVENEKATFGVGTTGMSAATVSLDIPVVGINTVQLGGSQYQEVSLPGGDKLIEGMVAVEGEPEIPAISTFLAIPDQAGIEYSVEYSGFDIIEGVDLMPNQPPTPESGPSDIPFTINENVYNEDRFYPGELGNVGDPVIMRDIRMVRVSMYPVQYNPVKRQLKVYRDLNISVSFTGNNVVNPKTTRTAYLSDAFYPMYQALVSNFDQFFSTTDVRRGGLLIITKAMFVDSLQAFVNWKHRKGYTVHVAPTTEIDPPDGNPTYSQIYNYIRNAYNNWEVPPEYVMIVGDQDNTTYTGIPDYPYQGYTSDNSYAAVDGNDYIPDIFLARFSVDNMSQLSIGLAKILAYETHPYMENLDHWRRGLSVAGNVYASTPRLTVLWVRHLLLEHGFTHVDTSFRWSSGQSDPYLLGYFNNGPCLISYRGWAGPSGWYSPSFNTSNLNQINNDNMLGVMASIVCGTGHFGTDECFGERWIRMGSSTTRYKGGPAFFGSTDTSTHTEWNNPIMTGYYWGIFKEGIYHFAAAAVRGKIQQYNTFPRNNGPGSVVNKYFNTYNMLGDPELEVRTAPPTMLSVMHPQSVHFGLNYIAINVTDNLEAPVEGAYVSLLKETDGIEEVFAIDRTDEYGNVHLQFDPATPGEMLLTVSGRNLYPYQSTIDITEGDLVVGHDSHEIDDDNIGFSSGNGDGIANPGETIELSVSLKNFSTDQNVNNVTADLSVIDPTKAAVYDSHRSFGNIAPGETGTSETPYVVRISPDIADGELIRFLITATDGQNSWESVAAVTVNAPKFIVSNINFPGGNGRLDPGETLDMILTLENAGSVDASVVTATISTIDDYTQIQNDAGEFGNIPVGGSGSNSGSAMTVSSDASTFDGRHINFMLNTLTADGYESTVPFTVNIGLIQSSDPLGPDNYGYYVYDNTDSGYGPTPTYEWTEIVPSLGGSGTRINFSGGTDDNSAVITVPFDFRYYGEIYRNLLVCINGFVAPDTDSIDMGGNRWANFYNWPIPDPGSARGQISPFWDDLSFSGSTYGVYYWYDTDNNRFIIEWYHMTHRNTSATETFELVITDPQYHPTLTNDSEITYLYNSIVNNDSGEHYASVGFESFDELTGIEYTYDGFYDNGAATLTSGRAIKITTNTGRGAIGGNVDLSNFGFNQGIIVVTTTGQHRVTPESGDYWIKEVPVGETDITASGEGYFPMTITGVNVAADMTTPDVDFAMTSCPVPQNLAASEGLGDRIEVTWDPVGHQDLVGYDVYRGSWENGVFEKLNSDPIADESFTDTEVPDNLVYWYYVTAVYAGDYGDAVSFGSAKDYGSLDEVTGVEDPGMTVPEQFFIAQNYPNPFNPSTTISYGLPNDADVVVEIYNVLGQSVRTLVDEHQEAGYKSIVWDAQDDSGSRVSSGVYFYTVRADDYHASKKMMLIK